MNKKSGRTGVYWNIHKQKWHVRIRSHGRRYELGQFKKLDDAVEARIEGEAKYWKKGAIKT